jgi:hypothetical protein
MLLLRGFSSCRLRALAVQRRKLIKVLYIVGAERSGSTLVDTVLGNHPDIVGVGELGQIVKLGYKESERCSCGKVLDDCEFFEQVRALYLARTGDSDFDYYERLRVKYESKRAWPKLLFGLVKSSEISEYCARTRAILESIAEVSGRPMVLDSSKKFSRLVALSFCREIQIVPIHLVRHCCGFVYSTKKSQLRTGFANKTVVVKPKPTIMAVLHWNVVNWLSLASLAFLRFRRGQSQWVFTSYETFCDDPETSLRDIGSAINLDMASLAGRAGGGETFDILHKVGGNLMKYNQTLKIRFDDAWKRELPKATRFATWFFSWPLMFFYSWASQRDKRTSDRR